MEKFQVKIAPTFPSSCMTSCRNTYKIGVDGPSRHNGVSSRAADCFFIIIISYSSCSSSTGRWWKRRNRCYSASASSSSPPPPSAAAAAVRPRQRCKYRSSGNWSLGAVLVGNHCPEMQSTSVHSVMSGVTSAGRPSRGCCCCRGSRWSGGRVAGRPAGRSIVVAMVQGWNEELWRDDSTWKRWWPDRLFVGRSGCLTRDDTESTWIVSGNRRDPKSEARSEDYAVRTSDPIWHGATDTQLSFTKYINSFSTKIMYTSLLWIYIWFTNNITSFPCRNFCRAIWEADLRCGQPTAHAAWRKHELEASESQVARTFILFIHCT